MTIYIPITAMPTPRPRIDPRSHRVYLPQWYKNYKETIAKYFLNAKVVMFNTDVAVRIDVYKKKRLETRIYGDVDNIAKGILDAGNGILWKDDSIITYLSLQKHFSEQEYIAVSVDGK